MDICTILPSVPCEFPSSDVTVLQGHTSEVWSYYCEILNLHFWLKEELWWIYCLVREHAFLMLLYITGFCLCMESYRVTSGFWVSLNSKCYLFWINYVYFPLRKWHISHLINHCHPGSSYAHYGYCLIGLETQLPEFGLLMGHLVAIQKMGLPMSYLGISRVEQMRKAKMWQH